LKKKTQREREREREREKKKAKCWAFFGLWGEREPHELGRKCFNIKKFSVRKRIYEKDTMTDCENKPTTVGVEPTTF
jgi:hypothetical protein